ncbi:MAG TPA: shikimate dehydrogenase, partial [Saprospirales bacterium]|nr:shikimate dehydrogenase [Saprospirales bacterium]
TRAEKQGAAIMNGLSMLHDQADESWKIWNRIL